jgi:sulfite reductase (ferredoxin)
MKSGLREIIRRFRCGVRLTANQDILLTDLHEEDKGEIEALLREYGIQRETELSNAQLYSMACPALPTCGLALAEAERALPTVIDDLAAALARLGLQDEKLSIRMTGCPNGCARPYVADLAFVGRSLDKYVVFVGGHSNGTRLNVPYADLVPGDALLETVQPLFVYFKNERQNGETFGDFCQRVSVEALQSFAESYQGEPVHA